jgi:hypothetical protein
MPITPGDAQLHFGKRLISGQVTATGTSQAVNLSGENITSVDYVLLTLKANSAKALAATISGKTFTIYGVANGDVVMYLAVCTPA